MNKKACTKCGVTKSVEDFYPAEARCKECAKASVRANRAKNIDYYRKYDRERFQNDPERRKRTIALTRRRRLSVPGRSRAHSAVSYAVRSGRLVPQPCEVCAHPCTHAHHDDYSKPLDVMWLCPVHHSERHRKILKK